MLLRNPLFLLLLFSSTSTMAADLACPDYTGYYFGTPTAEEQVHLELINRARANPTAEAKIYGLSSVTEGVDSKDLSKMSTSAMQPLTFNSRLNKAARLHSQDMATNEYFEHISLNGDNPFKRIKAQSYSYKRAGENIAYRSSTGKLDKAETSIKMHGDLFIDARVAGRGHRVTILTPDYKEIGIGMASGVRKQVYNTYYITDDFAASSSSACHFITGVVYDDANKDNFYTVGEGIKDVRISIENSSSSGKTASSGGYGIPVEDGTYKVTFTHSTHGTYSKTVKVSGKSVKLDALAAKFSSGSAGDDDPNTGDDTPNPGDDDPDTTVPEYAVSTYDVTSTMLLIKAMAADGYTEKYDVSAKYAPISTLSKTEINTIQAKVQAITQLTGDANNMSVFKLTTDIKPVQSEIHGATYTMPALIAVHDLHVMQGSTIANKLEVLFIYVEVNGSGYLVIYGTKQK